MAPSLRCPRCATIVSVTPGQVPTCPACGFSGPAPGVAASPAPSSAAAAPPAESTDPALIRPLSPVDAAAGSAPSPWASPAEASAFPPAPAPAPAPAIHGKVVHPGLVVLFHVITLGIYFLPFWWRTSREADEATSQRHAHPITRTGVWFIVAAIAGLIVVAVAAVAIVADTIIENEGDPTYDEEQFFRDLLGAGIAIIGAAILLVLLAVAGRICILVGQYRVWKATRDLELRMGASKTVPVGLFLGVSIAAIVLGNGGNASSGEVAVFFDGLLGLAALVAYLTIAALTQSHLNGLWQGRPGA